MYTAALSVWACCVRARMRVRARVNALLVVVPKLSPDCPKLGKPARAPNPEQVRRQPLLA